jgi:hypothetical protein
MREPHMFVPRALDTSNVFLSLSDIECLAHIITSLTAE